MVSEKDRRRLIASGAGASLFGLLPAYHDNVDRVFHGVLVLSLGGLAVATPVFGLGVAALGVFAPLMVLACLVKVGERHPNPVFAAGSVIIAVILIALVISPSLSSPVTPSPVPLGVYALPVAAAIAPFMFPENRPGTRGVAALVGQVPVLLGAGVSVYSPTGGVVAAIVLILAVNCFVGGGRMLVRQFVAMTRSGISPRRRSRVQANSARARKFDEANVVRGAEAELATGAALDSLRAQGWTIFHSRALPGTHADVDHIAVGLSGVIVLDSKDWKGELALATTDGAPEGRINGSAERFMRAIETVQFEAETVADYLHLSHTEVRAVLVFTSRMVLPSEVTTVQTPASAVTVDVINIEQAVAHLAGLPAMRWQELSAKKAAKAAKRGLSQDEARVQADREFVEDLAAVVDYTFPINRH